MGAVQGKALAAVAADAQQRGLHGFQAVNMGQRAITVQRGLLAGHGHFLPLLYPGHAKGRLLAVAAAHQVQVAHFKNLQIQAAVWEEAGGEGEQGDGFHDVAGGWRCGRILSRPEPLDAAMDQSPCPPAPTA